MRTRHRLSLRLLQRLPCKVVVAWVAWVVVMEEVVVVCMEVVVVEYIRPPLGTVWDRSCSAVQVVVVVVPVVMLPLLLPVWVAALALEEQVGEVEEVGIMQVGHQPLLWPPSAASSVVWVLVACSAPPGSSDAHPTPPHPARAPRWSPSSRSHTPARSKPSLRLRVAAPSSARRPTAPQCTLRPSLPPSLMLQLKR